MFQASGIAPSAPPPLVGFVNADDPGFARLRQVAEATHLLPSDLLPGARSVMVFFLPLDPAVVAANAAHAEEVSELWGRAYVETNALISRMVEQVTKELEARGHAAAWAPPTDNFDPETLVSRWSHRSVAALAGLGSFGLHHLLITDLGCCGRMGSLVTDAPLPSTAREPEVRCAYLEDESCMECVQACPVDALDLDGSLDKQRCWRRLQDVEQGGVDKVCGKCGVMGPCALESPL